MQPTLISRPDGSIAGIRRTKIGEIPYFFLTDNPNNSVSIGANSVAGPVSMSSSYRGPGQIVSMAYEKTGVLLALLAIQDGNNNMPLMNAACHGDTIFGTGLNPYPLPAGLYIDENRQINVTFNDISGAANATRIALKAQRFLKAVHDADTRKARARLKSREFLWMPYFYTFSTSNIVLAGSAAKEVEIAIGPGHHFQLYQISGTSTGNYTINILDGSTGESLIRAPAGQNFEIPNTLLVGSAAFPFRLHQPVLFEDGSRIVIRLTDTSSSTNTIYLTFGGRAIATRMWE